MPTPSFDILRRHEDGSFLWVEAEHSIDIAKVRLQELCVATPGNYFVFDQKSQQIVAKLPADWATDAFARCQGVKASTVHSFLHERKASCTGFTGWRERRRATIVPQSRTRL
jgi:hypothetical protein